MGFYINPDDGNKLKWLKDHDAVRHPTKYDDFYGSQGWYNRQIQSGRVPLALVDNGAFYALGVAYCFNEFEVFRDIRDGRPITIFTVEINRLVENTGLSSRIINLIREGVNVTRA